ncbi:hypothetical protein [Arcanobacterium phocae]|uniref:hypothetical protein n=1 Tax=Arcanobacterium phocae TaxID=131112 RepID=UPI001C10B608|nr:hypothetical protein [Arcanobacterium phocae]
MGTVFALKQSNKHGQTRPIQRCFFHIYQRVIQLLTTCPRTQAGIEILQLTKTLMNISTPTQASSWLVQYSQWETR